MQTFNQKVQSSLTKSLLCIGLDPVEQKLPVHLQGEPDGYFQFCKDIVDATAEYVCGFKPNSAFFELRGVDGIAQLKRLCDYIKENYPEHLLILDAKRGDIGSTNEGYAYFAFDYLGVDALTLHPYLGREANLPFLTRKDKGCIFLCKTSNPQSAEFQNVHLKENIPLYQYVAQKISKYWNENDNCLLVVGATYPEELAEVRSIVGKMPLLIPGIGEQGGDLEKTLKAGLTQDVSGLIITVSRSIIYAGDGADFATESGEEAKKLGSQISTFRSRY